MRASSFRFVRFNRFAFAALAATAALIGSAKQAKADITYQIQNANWVGGGSLTGTFTLNDARNTLISANLATTAGTLVAGTYTYPNPTITPYGSGSGNLGFVSSTTFGVLELVFSPTLPTSGSTTLTTGSSEMYPGPNNSRYLAPGATVYVVGPAAAAPEPSTLALLGIGGLGMAGVAARKRKAN
jgi:hypothetical protein